jgi:hypothetical protein
MDAHRLDNAATASAGLACATYDWWLPHLAGLHSAAESVTFWGGVVLVVAGVAREGWRVVRWVRA